jgi:hypothetical protein
MKQLGVSQPGPSSNASPGSVQSAGSDKRRLAPSKIPGNKLERNPSISEQYFSHACASGKKKRVSTNGDGSPQRIRYEVSPQSSPERRLRQIPKGPRRNISKGTSGHWVPPMPNILSLPPPVPEHRANHDVWQFGPCIAESTAETVEIVYEEEERKANPRRLSIPPSMVLRPLLAHGPLDASPSKTSPEAGLISLKEKALPPSPRRRARAETGGMLKCVMANAVRRRNLTKSDTRRDDSGARV